jgi:5-methylcytosine-specific restriction endonuclease McrA
MRLRPTERCPLHPRGNCVCRRQDARLRKIGSKWEQVRPGVRRIKDRFADHPDGYRYKLSRAEMRKVLLRKVEEQKGICAIGGEPFSSMEDVVADHIKPKGIGGARADDRAENIQAACGKHNLEKGSKR